MLDYASIPESERIIDALDSDECLSRELAEQLVGRATSLKKAIPWLPILKIWDLIFLLT